MGRFGYRLIEEPSLLSLKNTSMAWVSLAYDEYGRIPPLELRRNHLLLQHRTRFLLGLRL